MANSWTTGYWTTGIKAFFYNHTVGLEPIWNIFYVYCTLFSSSLILVLIYYIVKCECMSQCSFREGKTNIAVKIKKKYLGNNEK